MGGGSWAAMSFTCRDRRRLRARWRAALRCACVATALAAAPAPGRAETQAEPILRLSLEGAYDSNPLFDGRSDQRTRVSPELGLKLSDHNWSMSGAYAADYLSYQRLDPAGVWNHRGILDLSSHLTERTRLSATARGTYAVDPIGLAQAGVFRVGRQRAVLLQGSGRVEHDVSERFVGAVAFTERLVRFQDLTGGAMHAPSAELLRRLSERFLVGGAYGFSLFQDFQSGGGDRTATAQALRARLRYQLSRFLEADVYAGPAFWSGPSRRAVVPEGGIELRLTERDWDLRFIVSHGLGLGSTAVPGLGNTIELGTVRRFGRTFDLRVDGGLWQSGTVPSGSNSTLGVAAAGEAGWHATRALRFAVAASWLGRLDDRAADLRRTTVGLRMGWELPVR